MKGVFLAALLLTLSAPAGAQGQQRFEQRIEAARRQATDAGVPASLLNDKVAEGRAKGIPAERIAAAVEHRLASLVRARQAMGTRPVGPGDLSVGADALEAGVTPQVLGTLAARTPPPQRAVAIAVLTQLVREGQSSERALERVQAALTRGPDALRNLPGEASPAEETRGDAPPGLGRDREPGARGTDGTRRGGGPPAAVPAPGQNPGHGRNNQGRPRGKP
jgi:hypothetical protein